MGGHPWMYFVPYERDLQHALDTLKERELLAGRYNPVMPELPFPVEPDGPAPGAGHASIDEAREAADADGTRSILDMERIGGKPRPPRPSQEELFAAMARAQRDGGVLDLGAMAGLMPEMDDFGVVAPVAPEVLRQLYGSDRPTRAAVRANLGFLDEVDRGTGVYIVVYEGDRPTEICFAGYSYD